MSVRIAMNWRPAYTTEWYSVFTKQQQQKPKTKESKFIREGWAWIWKQTADYVGCGAFSSEFLVVHAFISSAGLHREFWTIQESLSQTSRQQTKPNKQAQFFQMETFKKQSGKPFGWELTKS